MIAEPPFEPPILTAEDVANLRSTADLSRTGAPVGVALRLVADSHEALRARLRDAEETLRLIAQRGTFSIDRLPAREALARLAEGEPQ